MLHRVIGGLFVCFDEHIANDMSCTVAQIVNVISERQFDEKKLFLLKRY